MFSKSLKETPKKNLSRENTDAKIKEFSFANSFN